MMKIADSDIAAYMDLIGLDMADAEFLFGPCPLASVVIKDARARAEGEVVR